MTKLTSATLPVKAAHVVSDLEMKLTEELRHVRSCCKEVHKILTLCLVNGNIITSSDKELALKYLEAAVTQG